MQINFLLARLEIVNLWNSGHGSRASVVPILLKIGELVTCFTSFIIQHVLRSANNSAHLCAKHVSTLLVTNSWLDCTSDFLVISLQADRSGSFLAE
jgi:hypothetical protein